MNDIVSNKSTSSCRIKGLLDECGKVVNDPKCVGNLMNKYFVKIAEKLLKERENMLLM